MSWEATTWVLRESRTQGNAKLVLLGLANHAWPDGTHAYPSVDTLAHYANVDRRTAQRNLRKLEVEGHITRDGVGSEGQTRWRIEMGGGNLPPVASQAGGAASAVEGGGTRAARTIKEPTKNPPTENSARERIPEDFPDELRPHARLVLKVLRDVAEVTKANAVSPRSLALVIQARPRKPLVMAAHDYAAWLLGGKKRHRDVVAGYRNWLDNTNDLAGLEALPGEGAVRNERNVRGRRHAEDERRAQHAKDMLRRAGIGDDA